MYSKYESDVPLTDASCELSMESGDCRRLWTTQDVCTTSGRRNERCDGWATSESATSKSQSTAASLRPERRCRRLTSSTKLPTPATSHRSRAAVTRRHRTCVTSCPRDWCATVWRTTTRLQRLNLMTIDRRELAVRSRKQCDHERK